MGWFLYTFVAVGPFPCFLLCVTCYLISVCLAFNVLCVCLSLFLCYSGDDGQEENRKMIQKWKHRGGEGFRTGAIERQSGTYVQTATKEMIRRTRRAGRGFSRTSEGNSHFKHLFLNFSLGLMFYLFLFGIWIYKWIGIDSLEGAFNCQWIY